MDTQLPSSSNDGQAGKARSGMPPRQSMLLRILLLVTLVLFAIGITTPMLTVTKLILFNHSFSVVSGVVELFRRGKYLLFILIAGFSVLLPLFKLWVLWQLSSTAREPSATIRGRLRLMHTYGRWAMLDVMVVAVMIMTVKLGDIASIQVHFGLYVFGAAVLAIMLLTQWVMQLMEQMIEKPASPGRHE